MATRVGGRRSKNAIMSRRRSFLRRTGLSAASTPWSWKMCLDVSMPMRLTCSMDGLLTGDLQRPHLGTAMPSRGPSPPTLVSRVWHLAEDLVGEALAELARPLPHGLMAHV